MTNDDGIDAPGLAALAVAMAEVGDLTIIAPQREMSAVGHALSVKKEHALRPFERDGRLFGHGFEGTPADCVKFAVDAWMRPPPDLVVSGINPGANFGTNVPYSGTVAAALEAAILDVPGIAVSIGHPQVGANIDFAPAARVAACLARDVLDRGLAPGVALSLNVPALPESEIRGFRVVPQGGFRVRDHFKQIEPAPGGAPRWSNVGADFIYSPAGAETDDRAMTGGYVAVTPLSFDMTAHGQLDEWRRRVGGKAVRE